MSQWLSIQALADRWDVDYDTIRREAIAGKIPSLKVGAQRRISRAWVEKVESAVQSANLEQVRQQAKRVKNYAGTDHYPEIQ